MKKNGIYMLLTVAVMLVIALLPSSSQPRSDKATDTVVSLEQSRDDGVHNLKGCEGVFTASQSRITECRHNETYSRIVSESGLPHSESLTLKKSSDAVPCIRPTLHYKYASHRLHLFSRLTFSRFPADPSGFGRFLIFFSRHLSARCERLSVRA